MSVFATHGRPGIGRALGAWAAFVVVVAGSVYFGHALRTSLTASQLHALLPTQTPVPLAQETVFPEPQDIQWDGYIFGVLVGGQGVAVHRDDGQLFQAYMLDGSQVPFTEGSVHIEGRWTGISCAYAATLFNGGCTPTVDIGSIVQLPVRPQ